MHFLQKVARRIRRAIGLGPSGTDYRAALLALLPKGAVGVEVGVWRGAFSERLLRVTTPARLHLVDPWAFQPQFPGRLYGGAAVDGQAGMDAIFADVTARLGSRPDVTIHRMTSTAFFAAGHGPFDWVYIDGDHGRQAVIDDLEGAWATVRPGGLICGDDYYWRDADGSQSVRAAVTAFCAARGVTARLVGHQFVITRP